MVRMRISAFYICLTLPFPEIAEYGYRRQIYCDPTETPVYFNALHQIMHWATSVAHSSRDGLSNLVGIEISRGVWTVETLRECAVLLGLAQQSEEGVVGVLFGDDPDPAIIRDAWLKKVKDLNADFAAGRVRDKEALGQRKHELKEAYRIVSEGTGKAQVVAAYEDAIKLYGSMDITEAYQTLEVPAELDDEMIVTIFAMRVRIRL